MTKLYGVAELADAIGTDPGTIAVWRYRGQVPEPHVELKCGPVWTHEEIKNWIRRERRALRG